jgi:hypothetical protein
MIECYCVGRAVLCRCLTPTQTHIEHQTQFQCEMSVLHSLLNSLCHVKQENGTKKIKYLLIKLLH